MRRISVIGSSASGKTRTASIVSQILGVPHLELDSVFHRSGWQPLDDASFRAAVAAVAQRDAWVIDGNYLSHGVAQVVWPRADTLVWLDPPRTTVLRRALGRTLRRLVAREELWNGNRESWRGIFSPKPEDNIVLWAWTRHAPTRERYEAMLRDGTWQHLSVRRLRTTADVRSFLDEVRAAGPGIAAPGAP
jgi:adenylate kinase family enzyme